MQVKQWIVIAGLMVAAPLLVACDDKKAGDEAAPPAADAAAPADGAPADEIEAPPAEVEGE
ncbi:MAG: hypothetical protein Q7N95_14695 [Alphaproteobacteria bacterium]|nr:hypothetical protein [Alphaproteobacteria bacterium]